MHQLTSNPNVAVATAARELLGTAGFGLIYLTIFIAYATGINATYFSIFRISRALAEDKELPAFYHQKFWRFGTKGNLFTTVLIILATVLFDFNAIVNLSSGAFLVCYLGRFCRCLAAAQKDWRIFGSHRHGLPADAVYFCGLYV